MIARIRLAIFGAGFLIAISPPAQPQSLARTPDGHPDLQGTWSSATLTPLQRRAEFKDHATLTEQQARAWEKKGPRFFEDRPDLSNEARERVKQALAIGADTSEAWEAGTTLARVHGLARTSLIVDPPDGKTPPLTPEAKQRSAAAQKNADHPHTFHDFDLAERCLTYAPVPILPQAYNGNFQIIQTPDTVMILSEMIHEARVVRMNASHAPASVRLWNGDSVGRWEGDTLVIDTANFNSQGGYRGQTTEKLHVLERLTRLDADTILYRATLDDPATYTRPWTIEYPLKYTMDRIFEFACHEGNTYIESALKLERKIEAEAGNK